VDTSIWSLGLRRKREDLNAAEKSLADELFELVREGRVRIIGLVRQDLLSGVKTTAQFEKLRATLGPFSDELIETADYEAAARASNECRAKGKVGSVVDMLICAIALKQNLAIFTADADFNNYALVLPIRLHTPRKVETRGN
jgi:predicted nucleic acid-binding protein